MSTPGRVATGAVIALLTACGGSGNDIGGRGGGGTGYAYIATTSSSSQGSVIPYAISGDGSLSPLSSGPVPTGMNPMSIVADPSGHYVYVVNLGDATISQFSVGSGGALAALSPAVVSIPTPSTGIRSYTASIDPNGHYLYVVYQSYPTVLLVPTAPPVVWQFSIGSGGALTPLSPSSVSLSALTTGPLAIDPGGQHAYLPGGAQVSQFSISGSGTLVPLATPSIATTNAVNVTIAPDGRTAYVLSSCIDTACDGQISVYSVAADGTLSPTGSTTGTAGHVIPIELETDTSGSSAYLLANLMGVDTDAGSLYQFAIGSTGALQPDSPPSVNVTGGAVAASVFGPSLYALDNPGFASGTPQGGHIDHYAIGPGGLLTAKDSVSMTSGYPTAMTIAASH